MKILVAGIGNLFLGDDGWGCAVASALRTAIATAPDRPGVEVDVVDFGIRGMDLAYALTSGIDAAILVDAVARGGAPGTLYVIEPQVDGEQTIETHAMTPGAVLRLARSFGTLPPMIRVLGCEPARLIDPDTDEVAVELSPAVTAAIPPAIDLVRDLIARMVAAVPSQEAAVSSQEIACTS